MSSVNKVIIVGNLGQDPETRTFPDGGSLTNISVATSESWKDKQTGEKKERTEWHKIVFNGKLAEIAAMYLHKGSKVYIEGSIRNRKYQDKQTGQDRYITDIVAREMKMLDSKGDGQQTSTYNRPQTQQQLNNPSYVDHNRSAPPAAPAAFEFDDDIPF